MGLKPTQTIMDRAEGLARKGFPTSRIPQACYVASDVWAAWWKKGKEQAENGQVKFDNDWNIQEAPPEGELYVRVWRQQQANWEEISERYMKHLKEGDGVADMKDANVRVAIRQSLETEFPQDYGAEASGDVKVPEGIMALSDKLDDKRNDKNS